MFQSMPFMPEMRGHLSVDTLPTSMLLALALSYAMIVLPISAVVLLIGPPDRTKDVEAAYRYVVYQRSLHRLLAIVGLILGLGAAVPQAHLMLKRHARGRGLGNLSVDGLALQAQGFFYLAVAQTMRLGFPIFAGGTRVELTSYEWFAFVNGCAVGFAALALGHMLLWGLAKWIEKKSKESKQACALPANGPEKEILVEL
jgi:hypothetical protein